MATSEIQPLAEMEVKEQLEALGYHNFSPEKIKQITKDLAAYLADEGLLTDSTDPSFVSDSTPQESPDRAQSRQPLYDVPGPSYYQQHYVRFDHPDITGKENYSKSFPEGREKRFPDCGETRAYYNDSSFTSTNADETLYSEDGKSSLRVQPNAKSKPFIKRKVVRKRNVRSQVFDESVTESESDLSYINDRLADLRLPLRGEELQDEDADSEASTVTNQMHQRRRPKSSSKWSDGASSSSLERYSSQPLKSFIRPCSAPPKWRHDKKTDPVTRHQMYAAQWKTIKAPGERSHKGLRWHIREQMLYKDDIVLPRHNPRIYIPNKYEVPTEKKRQALRWAVRNSLANREMPYSTFNF